MNTTIEKTEIWINKTKSEKAITIEIESKIYITSLSSVQKLVLGEYKGVNIGVLNGDGNIEDTEYWISKTKSGKAVTIVINERVYITSFQSIENLVSGKYKGVNLGELVKV